MATSLYLTNASSTADSAAEATRNVLNSSPGASSTGQCKAGATGPTAPLKITTSNTATDGSVVAWFTPSLLPVTIDGAITLNIWAGESYTGANIAPVFGVYHVDANGAELATIVDPATNQAAGELPQISSPGYANFAITIPAGSVATEAIPAGDRIKVCVFIDDAADQGGSGNMTASGRYARFYVNGGTPGAQGWAEVVFTEAVVFGSAIAVGDSGTCADSLTVTGAADAVVTLADAGVGADNATATTATIAGYSMGYLAAGGGYLAPNRSLIDAGTAADNVTVAAVVPFSDNGAGADILSAAVSVTLSDVATEADSAGTTATVPLSDTGVAADTETVAGSSVGYDTGASSQSLDVVATGSRVDSGQSDNTLVVAAVGSLADAASATDTLSVAGRHLSLIWYPGWIQDTVPPDVPDYSAYNIVSHFGCSPNLTGGVDFTEIPAGMQSATVTAAHAAGNLCILTVGGAGTADGFVASAGDVYIDTFVENIVNASVTYGYDGIDVDWEASVTQAPYARLISKLRGALPPGKLLTIDVYSYDVAPSIVAEVEPYVDLVNVMSYYDNGHAQIDAYTAAGVPADKLLVGIGLYTVDYYDTTPTRVQNKCNYAGANGLAGVCSWSMEWLDTSVTDARLIPLRQWVAAGSSNVVVLGDVGAVADSLTADANTLLRDAGVGSETCAASVDAQCSDTGAGSDSVAVAGPTFNIFNTFESVPNATRISVANSAGIDGSTAIVSMTTPTGGTLDGDTSKSAHGTTSLKVATGATAGSSMVRFGLGNTDTLFVRFYLWMAANPAASRKILQVNDAANAVNCGGILINTAGLLRNQYSAGGFSYTSPTPIAMGQWVRFEFGIFSNASTGSVEVRYWANSDDLGPPDLTNITTGVNTGAGDAGLPMLGNQTSTANVVAYWIDDFAASTVDWIGPAVTTLAPNDVGAGSDSLAVAATTSWTDAGTGADSATIARPVTFNDSATSVDSVTPVTAVVTLSDAGTGTDSATLARPVALNDSGVSADTAAVVAVVAVGDAGTAADGLAIEHPIALSGAGTGADSITTAAAVGLGEAGVGADALVVAATAALSDTGTSADSVSVAQGSPKTLSDTGSGTDSISSVATASTDDAGAVVDGLATAATAQLADAGTGSDGLAVGAPIALAEAGTAADGLSSAAVVVVPDVATGTDGVAVAATVGLSDTGSVADGLGTAAAVSVSDAAVGADTLSVSFANAATLSESGHETDAIPVSATASLGDATAAAADTLGVSKTFSLADAGAATDGLVGIRLVTLDDAGTCADNVSVPAALDVPDTGFGSDGLAVAATVELDDDGIGTDGFSVAGIGAPSPSTVRTYVVITSTVTMTTVALSAITNQLTPISAVTARVG